MANERLGMRNIREVLRLYFLGNANSRAIARAVGCSKSGVNNCVERARAAGLTEWAQIEGIAEIELERALYPHTPEALLSTQPRRELPDYAKVHAELRRRDHQVTLALLWHEYKQDHPD